MKKLILFFCLLFIITLTSCRKHIEDTNGPENFTLQTITDEQICSSSSSVVKSKLINNKVDYSSAIYHKISGVDKLKTIVVKDKTIVLSIENIVNAGNAKIVFINDGKIIFNIPLNSQDVYEFPNSNGKYELRVAGESANIEIKYKLYSR